MGEGGSVGRGSMGGQQGGEEEGGQGGTFGGASAPPLNCMHTEAPGISAALPEGCTFTKYARAHIVTHTYTTHS